MNKWPAHWDLWPNTGNQRIPAPIMPRFSPGLWLLLATPGLTGPMDQAEGKAGAEDGEAANEGASSADASGPIMGAQQTIIQTDAHLEGENMLEVALSA